MNFRQFSSVYSSLVRWSSVHAIITTLIFIPAFLLVVWFMPWLAPQQRWMLIAPLVVALPIVALTSHRLDRARWRRTELRCEQCRMPFDRSAATTAMTQKTCPGCGQYPFAPSIDAAPKFSDVDPATLRRKTDDDQPSRAVDAARELNPYAPPADVSTPSQAIGLWQLPALWVSSVAKSLGTLFSSRARILAAVNRELEKFDSGSLSPQFEESTVSSQRRFAGWYLFWVLLLPLGTTVICAAALRLWEGFAVIRIAIVVFGWLTATFVGLFVYSATLTHGPMSWRRWLRGNPPPLCAERDPETGLYGIRLFWTGAADDLSRPRLLVNYRVDRAADVRLCLVNTNEAKQFEIVVACGQPGVWADAEVDFDLLLRESDSTFAGDEIRVIPPDDVRMEIDGFQIALPPQPGNGVPGST